MHVVKLNVKKNIKDVALTNMHLCGKADIHPYKITYLKGRVLSAYSYKVESFIINYLCI